MGVISFVACFFFLAATIFMIVSSVSAPTANGIGLLTVRLDEGAKLVFGSFGYCLHGDGDDVCSGSHVGYNPVRALENFSQYDLSNTRETTAKALTRVMVLHPVAAVLAFLTFVVAFFAHGVMASLIGTLLGVLTFIVSLVVMVTDFVWVAIVRNAVNDDADGSPAKFSTAMWTTLIATICALIGTIVVFFACCSSRRKDRHAKYGTEKPVRTGGFLGRFRRGRRTV
jgi:hypothetical protein